MIECSFGPSGVPSCSLPIHERNCGSSLIMENGSHVSPPSSERKRPCGEVPAYQAFGSLAWHGVSQNVCLTVRPVLPSGTQSIEKIRGLIRTQPTVGWGLLIGTMAIAGFPDGF